MRSLVLVLFVAGCAGIDQHAKVEGWPRLEVVEHFIPHAEMRERCGRYVAFGSSPEACAEFYFSEGRCDVWHSADFPPSSHVLEHERLHCAGYDHHGETSMSEALQRYRQQENLKQ